jgi:hypothetical protein
MQRMYYGLLRESTYFSICLIKWLLSHRPARERNPHLLQNENSLSNMPEQKTKMHWENWVDIIFMWQWYSYA